MCLVSNRECIIEFSVDKLKFYTVAFDMQSAKYFTFVIWRLQASKVIKATCIQAQDDNTNNLEHLVGHLEFKDPGGLQIKNYQILLQY